MVSNFKKNLTDVASLQKYLMNHFTRSFLILSWLLVSSSIQFGVYQFSCKKKQQQNSPPSLLSFDLLLISNSTRISNVQTIPSGKFYWRLSLCGYCGVKVSCSVGGLIVTDSGSDTHRLYSLLQPAACHICYTLAFYM